MPITVIQNDDIGACEIDAEAPSTSREEEDEFLAALLVIFVDS